MKTLLEQAQENKQEIIEDRRTIHRFAEVGKCLPQTKKFVMEKLRELGYEPEEICESGIVAVLEGKPGGKTILLRADMDALPVKEEADCDFCAENGNMHACGHDMHAAMLLGAARLLMENRDALEGTVKLVFQPDEEGFTGAKAMLAAGVLEDPKVDGAMALHVHSGTPSGQVLCGTGACMAGCRLFRILVKGTGCHGAMPETGVDPINIAAHIYLSLQEIVAREVAAMNPAVVTIGKFVGGDAPNMIPGEVVMEGSIRALDKELGERIYRRIDEISTATAKLFRGEAIVSEIASAPPLVNDPEMVREMASYVEELTPDRPLYIYPGGGMGSEDFSSYTQQVPSAYLLVGAGAAQEDPRYGKPMHNEKVMFDESVLPLGAAVYANCAVKWLKDHR